MGLALRIPSRSRHSVRIASLGSSNRPFPRRIPEWMAQSAVVRDYRTLEVGRRRSNRLVLTVRSSSVSLDRLVVEGAVTAGQEALIAHASIPVVRDVIAESLPRHVVLG